MIKKLMLIACMLMYGVAPALAVTDYLDLSLIKYDPYPVEPGKSFDVWVKVENLGDNDVNGASIEFIPRFPFSVQEGESSAKNPGTILKGKDVVYRFKLQADVNAVRGSNRITFGYKLGDLLYTRDFDIDVGTDVVDSRGTVTLEKVRVEPAVLMPGDRGTVTVTVKNSASQYSITLDKVYSLNAIIQSATLSGGDKIRVLSPPYSSVGVLGPGDSMDLVFDIEVDRSAPDGTYLLDLETRGSARLFGVNWKIPIEVDNTSAEIVLAEPPGTKDVVFNVVNPRQNSLSAVEVIPRSAGVRFSPETYFIGTMGADEMYTATFDFEGKSGDMAFSVRFKNGNNWHESAVKTVRMNSTEPLRTGGQTSIIPLLAIGLLLAVVIVFFVYMRRKRRSEK